MREIVVNTDKLRAYASRIQSVNSRLVKLDLRLDGLYRRVDVVELYQLLKADALTGYSWKLKRIKSYLDDTAYDFEHVEKKIANADAMNFNKPAVAGVTEVVYDIGVGIKKGCSKIKHAFESTVTYVVDSYYSKGWVYDAVLYGKAALKAAKGIIKIGTAVASLFGSGGMSAPVAILAIISGCNDVYNAIIDGTYVYTNQYDEVGKHNGLKDKLTENGKIIGEALGNEHAGEIFGKATYYGIDIVTTLASLDTAFDKIKQLTPTDGGQLLGELKEIGNLPVKNPLTMDVEAIKYEAKLASYTYKATSNFITNAAALAEVGDKAYSFSKSISSAITDGGSNSVIDFVDDVRSKIGYVKDGGKAVGKIAEVVFG